MDTFLRTVRSYGLKFSVFSSPQIFFLEIEKAVALFSMAMVSLLLVSCGGGSGPGEEGENYIVSQRLTNQNSNSAIAGESTLSNNTLQTKRVLTAPSVGWCQAANTLLCENFEWSSSLAYQASEQDWQLKGWQFNGQGLSGNDCNQMGSGGSQCALKWQQTSNAELNTQQTASYVFAQYGSTYNKIMLSWAASWSANWVWGETSNPHVSLGATNLSSRKTPFISLGFDSAGFIEVVIAEDKNCGRNKRIIKSDKALVFNNTEQVQWSQFQLTVEINANHSNASYNDTVQLSMNDEVVLSVSDADLSCTSTANTVTYLSNSLTPKAQTALIDNVLLTLQ